VIYVVHPKLRLLIHGVLSAVHAFTAFVSSLDEPILPPESQLRPIVQARDARATIVARDRVRDVGLAQGIEVITWGKALEGVNGECNLT
jgi:hypothetical protein